MPLTVEMKVGRADVQWMRRVLKISCEVAVPEVVLEEMTSRTVLKVTQEGCQGELYEEAAGYYNQMYMTIKREMD